MEFTFVARTDTGRVRTLNEDAILAEHAAASTAPRGDLLVVADGMGGHQSGEVASQQAIATIRERYFGNAVDSPIEALVAAIEAANRTVYQRAQQEGRQGMGTTVVAAARIDDRLHIAHVGDSRLYLIRGGQIQRLTHDHSLVEEQIAAGIITPEEAEHHPHRNVISRSVGTLPEVEVEVAPKSPLILHEGDRLVICSDGLTEHIKPSKILKLVDQRTPDAAADELIRAANAAGGSDNISVIVAQVGEVGLSSNTTLTTAPIVEETPPPPTPAPRSPDDPTAPLPRATAPAAATGPGLPIALLGILAALVAVAIIVLIAVDLVDQISDDPAPIVVTATSPNNLIVTVTVSSRDATATAEAAVAGPEGYPQETPQVETTGSPSATGTPAPTFTPITTPQPTPTP